VSPTPAKIVPMHDSQTPDRGLGRVTPGRAVIIGALIIALAILVLANEIRFQGCVSLQNQQFFHNQAAQKCSRLPWGAKL
jgi:hypothetical protein